MKNEPVRLRTTSVVAAEIGATQEQVLYVIKTRPDIKPIALAGNARLYDDHAVARIRHELAAIAARRDAKPQAMGVTL